MYNVYTWRQEKKWNTNKNIQFVNIKLSFVLLFSYKQNLHALRFQQEYDDVRYKHVWLSMQVLTFLPTFGFSFLSFSSSSSDDSSSEDSSSDDSSFFVTFCNVKYSETCLNLRPPEK